MNPFGIEFNTDGTRMFIVGTKGNGVDEFKLTNVLIFPQPHIWDFIL